MPMFDRAVSKRCTKGKKALEIQLKYGRKLLSLQAQLKATTILRAEVDRSGLSPRAFTSAKNRSSSKSQSSSKSIASRLSDRFRCSVSSIGGGKCIANKTPWSGV